MGVDVPDWNATLNLCFASSLRPRLQVDDRDFVDTLQALFETWLAPVAEFVDAETRYAAKRLT
ncbi:MAG: hypothetical protein M1296_07105 [Chloroflexi bacterium]|nr:hypothetical protein [Chloroflexota bacterium]